MWLSKFEPRRTRLLRSAKEAAKDSDSLDLKNDVSLTPARSLTRGRAKRSDLLVRPAPSGSSLSESLWGHA